MTTSDLRVRPATEAPAWRLAAGAVLMATLALAAERTK